MLTLDFSHLMRNPEYCGRSEKELNAICKDVPFPQRYGDPSYFADMVCTIIDNPYLNGETIRLDGALRMKF